MLTQSLQQLQVIDKKIHTDSIIKGGLQVVIFKSFLYNNFFYQKHIRSFILILKDQEG